jgi:HAD superfamily hydrolase (TIGR01509 family)
MPESPQPLSDPLACVIFDVDGTLAKSNDLIFASFNHVAMKYLGKSLPDREIIGLFGPPEEGGLRRILDEDLVPEAMDDLCRFYEERHPAMASLHHGITDILDFLKEKQIRLAVFTGKGRRTATMTLEQLGISGYFDLTVTGSDVRHHKPHPEGIVQVLKTLGVAPDRTLMVGDSVSDVRASRAVGVAAATVLWDCYDRASVLREDAAFRFERVADLMEWLVSRIESGNGSLS